MILVTLFLILPTAIAIGMLLSYKKRQKAQFMASELTNIDWRIPYDITLLKNHYQDNELGKDFILENAAGRGSESIEKAHKRRATALAVYNYNLSRCATMQETWRNPSVDATKIAKKLRRSGYRKLFFGCFLYLLPAFSAAAPSDSTALLQNMEKRKAALEQAEDFYNENSYREALPYYYQSLPADTPQTARIHYKIALCFNKLRECDSAFVHYRLAYAYNPETGGASSFEKFLEKIGECAILPEEIDSGLALASDVADDSYYKALLKEADQLYKSKQYIAALNLFEEIEASGSMEDMAVFHYKIALCYAKLKRCEDARVHYGRALEIDPEKGGASSREKFDKKSAECGFGESDSDDMGDWILGSIFLGLLLAVVVYRLGRRIIRTKLEINANSASKEAYDTAYSDAFRQRLDASGFNEQQVKQLRVLIAEIGGKFQHDTRSGREFGRLLQTVIAHPNYFIGNEAEYRSDLMQALFSYLDTGFYCFFTAEPIEEKRAMVVKLMLPGNKTYFVWATPKVIRALEKATNPPEQIKVRVHRLQDAFTHWSNDTTFYSIWKLQAMNLKEREKWQGEQRNVPLIQFHELLTRFPRWYRLSLPEAHVSFTLDLTAIRAHEYGKYSTTKSNTIADTSQDLDDIATATALGVTASTMHDDLPSDIS